MGENTFGAQWFLRNLLNEFLGLVVCSFDA
ncbi:homogentisate 1,2-dioxygenase [Pseudomonas syringae pv. tagetis]